MTADPAATPSSTVATRPTAARSTVLLALLILLALAAGPVAALVLVTTHAGAEFRGLPTDDTLAITLDQGGTATWPPAAFAEIVATGDGDRVRATLVNGEVVEGQLASELHLRDGLRRITVAPNELASARFHPFLPVDDKVESCPIRGEIDVTDEIVDKVWRVGRPRNLTCDGTFVSLIEVERRKASVRLPRGGRRPGQRYALRGTVWVAEGRDQHGHLRVELLQDGRVLGRAERAFEGDENEMNKVPLELWIADDVRTDGGRYTLRFQLVTVDDRREPEDDPTYQWLVGEAGDLPDGRH